VQGTGEIRVLAVRVLDGAGAPRERFLTGEDLVVATTFRTAEPVERPIFGVAVFRGDGVYVHGPYTRWDGVLDEANFADPHACDGSPQATPEHDRCVADNLLTFFERETNTLILRPLWPLEEQCTHAVVLKADASSSKASAPPVAAAAMTSCTAVMVTTICRGMSTTTPYMARQGTIP
jgi:hypothetical protein